MKPFFLLFTLLFCLSVQAKKKVHTPPVTIEGVSLSSTVNSGLDAFKSANMNDPRETRELAKFLLPEHGTYYYESSFGNFGEGFGFTENSYKYVDAGDRNPTDALRSNASVLNDNATDSQIVFRQGLYYGFAVMLALLNLVCFFLFEEKTFLYYSVALATTSLLLFFSDGLFALLELESNGNPLLTTSIFSFLAISFGALFASKYLLLGEFLPKLKQITLGLLGLSALMLLSGSLSSNPAFLHGVNAILFTVATTYFMAGIYLFSKKNYAKFFVIATFIPLLFCIDFFVLKPMGINFLSVQTAHIKAASIAEMLIITYAIMYRMQAIKEENLLRQAELRIFLKRQEVHTARKKTEKLVEDVYLENLIMHYDLDGLEIKLLQYISEGKDNSKIARKLKTTVDDIEELTKELYKKLEISEQIQHDYRLVDSQPDYIYN